MITACWSLKGGVGTSVIAAGLALGRHRRSSAPTLLVDLAGDQPVLLGMSERLGPGVAEWLDAGPAAPPDSLARLETSVLPGLSLLHRGHGELRASRAGLLVQMLVASGRPVVIDCGTLEWNGAATVAEQVASEAQRSFLVTRPCYLALRRAGRSPLRPSGVIVVREPGRVLDEQMFADSFLAPVVASVAWDPAVARAVDTGLLMSRLPRRFADLMGKLA